MIDIKQTPAIVLGSVGAYFVYHGLAHYISRTGRLFFLPELFLIGELLLGGGAIAISIRSFQNSDARLPLALLVGLAVAYGVGISDNYIGYDARALYLWAIPLSGLVVTVIMLYLLRNADTTDR